MESRERCSEAEQLQTGVLQMLEEIAAIVTEQLRAFREKDDRVRFRTLGQAVGEKERRIGAMRQHEIGHRWQSPADNDTHNPVRVSTVFDRRVSARGTTRLKRLPGNRSGLLIRLHFGKVNAPEIDRPVDQFDTDFQLSFVSRADINDTKLLLLAGAFIFHEDRLPFLDACAQGEQSTMRIDGDHLRRFLKRFSGCVRPVDMHRKR